MKKIILMICLFVSFDLKSETDDVTSKKFSCDDSVSINGLFSIIGFDFFSKNMTFYHSELQRVYLTYSKENIKPIHKK